jgi:hypothetical protein
VFCGRTISAGRRNGRHRCRAAAIKAL